MADFTQITLSLFSLVTEEAARFTKNLSNVEGTETDSVKMICEVSKASADVAWYRGDEELPEGGRYDQVMDGRKRILIIQDLRMEDAGEYNCRLSPTVKTSAMLKLNGRKSFSESRSHFKDQQILFFDEMMYFLLKENICYIEKHVQHRSPANKSYNDSPSG